MAATRAAESILRAATVGDPEKVRWLLVVVLMTEFNAWVAVERRAEAAAAGLKVVDAAREAAAAGTDPHEVAIQLHLLASGLANIGASDEAAAASSLAAQLRAV